MSRGKWKDVLPGCLITVSGSVFVLTTGTGSSENSWLGHFSGLSHAYMSRSACLFRSICVGRARQRQGRVTVAAQRVQSTGGAQRFTEGWTFSAPAAFTGIWMTQETFIIITLWMGATIACVLSLLLSLAVKMKSIRKFRVLRELAALDVWVLRPACSPTNSVFAQII